MKIKDTYIAAKHEWSLYWFVRYHCAYAYMYVKKI